MAEIDKHDIKSSPPTCYSFFPLHKQKDVIFDDDQ